MKGKTSTDQIPKESIPLAIFMGLDEDEQHDLINAVLHVSEVTEDVAGFGPVSVLEFLYKLGQQLT